MERLRDELEWVADRHDALLNELLAAKHAPEWTEPQSWIPSQEGDAGGVHLFEDVPLAVVHQDGHHTAAVAKPTNTVPLDRMVDTDVGVLLLDDQLRITYYTPGAQLPWLLDDSVVGKHLTQLTPRFYNEWLLDDVQQATTQPGVVEREVRREADGRWFLARTKPYRNGENVMRGVVVVFLDITEGKKREEALQELNKHLMDQAAEREALVRRLVSDLIRAQEMERERISHLLHGDLQQLLYGVYLQMGILREELPEELRLSDCGTKIQTLRDHLDQALEVTQQLTSDLSPPVLQSTDVVPPLQWLAMHVKAAHGLDVTLDATAPIHVQSREHNVLLYQIVQELLFNVVKHSGVQSAVLRVTQHQSTLVVQVEDAGIGFQPRFASLAKHRSGGFGLKYITEQIHLINWRIEIISAPGKGTRASIVIPS